LRQVTPESSPSEGLDPVARRLERGEPVSPASLRRLLTREAETERSAVNLRLALAYFHRYGASRDADALRSAQSCVERAWHLSHYSPEVLSLFLEIQRASGDISAVKDALKRSGMECGAQGDLGGALAFFDRWAYADFEFLARDLHFFDPEIISYVERLAALNSFDTHDTLDRPRSERLRIAHLMQALTESNSVLTKIDRVFARHYDKSRVEVAYFSADGERAVQASADAQATIEAVRNSGWDVLTVPDTGSVRQELLELGTRIHAFAPDILVTSAALATFKNYYVVSLRPAPLTIALHQGPSPQFTWHTFDHAISWFETNIVDCPTNCSHVPLEIDLPDPAAVSPTPRGALRIPAAATVVASGGRPAKFGDPAYWRAVDELMRQHDDLYWLCLGLSRDDVPAGVLGDESAQRMRFVGWRSDYLELLAAADLVADSYPVGGGVFLMEAMALALPVVSFEHDYISPFSNDNCSGGREIIGNPELVLARGDFESFRSVLSRLVRDDDYRRRVGTECREHVLRTRGDPSQMVRRCEEIYQTVFDDRQGGAAAHKARWASEDELDQFRLVLVEHAAALDIREAELERRDAGRLRRRLSRGARRAWSKLS
jgi:hypothetical protein